ncbi:MAG TPA: secondary thiamine-phosphate synthase enzyme YjbQ [Candidatus Norongarragalinales archaeon]|jgi:secondary thiamine-phosphate synthase enzyme|nr:secondary thiamine-phosphate synthase enzyme YjbQ [Candidatus Norongarragalinales archaeon]
MKTFTETLPLKTTKQFELVDITEKVKEAVKESQIKEGFCVVYSTHSTAGIVINEHEAGLSDDAADFFKKLVPPVGEYRHDKRHAPNAHSHIATMMIGVSENIPLEGGKLKFGTYQSVFLFEMDGPRARDVIVKVIGE